MTRLALARALAVTWAGVSCAAIVVIACGGASSNDDPGDFSDPRRRDGGRDGTLLDPVDGGGGGGDGAPGSCNGVCITQLAVGGSSVCAIGDDTAVRCWGDNDDGQSAVENAANVLIPRKVSGLTGVKEIAVGTSHACALQDDGRVFCSGRNASAIVTGTADTVPHPKPTEVKVPKPGLHIGAWSEHACVIAQGGDMYCWGSNDYGQCAVAGPDGGAPPAIVPKPSPRALGGVTLVGGSEAVTCAITAGASMSCFGRNFSGQLAQGASDFNNHPVPLPAQGVAGTIVQITRSNGYHLGIALFDGRLQTWGANANSAVQPDDGGLSEVTKPTVYPGLTNIKEVATGAYFSCARKGDGTVACWGDNSAGQIGLAPGGTEKAPRTIAGVAGATQIGAGRTGFACALTTGRVLCWGENAKGQLGRGKLGGRLPEAVEIRFDE